MRFEEIQRIYDKYTDNRVSLEIAKNREGKWTEDEKHCYLSIV